MEAAAVAVAAVAVAAAVRRATEAEVEATEAEVARRRPLEAERSEAGRVAASEEAVVALRLPLGSAAVARVAEKVAAAAKVVAPGKSDSQ